MKLFYLILIYIVFSIGACKDSDLQQSKDAPPESPLTTQANEDPLETTETADPGTTTPLQESSISEPLPSTPPTTTTTTTQTNYLAPIVIAHGMANSNSFAEEFDEILGKRGHPVFRDKKSVYESVEERGRQLVDQIREIVKETGLPKVHILGHSMGGLDARQAAILAPELVASVTSIATPHHGTKLADVALGYVQSDRKELIKTILTLMFRNIPEDHLLEASLIDMAEKGEEERNLKLKMMDGVYYQSWAGLSTIGGRKNARTEEDCQGKVLGNGEMDKINFILAPVVAFIGGIKALPGDGVVTAQSATHGNFQGCIPLSHLVQTTPSYNEVTDFDLSLFFETTFLDSLPETSFGD